MLWGLRSFRQRCAVGFEPDSLCPKIMAPSFYTSRPFLPTLVSPPGTPPIIQPHPGGRALTSGPLFPKPDCTFGVQRWGLADVGCLLILVFFHSGTVAYRDTLHISETFDERDFLYLFCDWSCAAGLRAILVLSVS